MIDSPETPESLRERWKTGIWKEALDAILAEAGSTTRKISAEFLRSLNTPEFAGRLDLRGIPFFEPLDPLAYGHDKCPLRLYGAEYRDIDFSHAVMRFHLDDTKLTNCLFLASTLESCSFWRSEIKSCLFSHSFMPWLSVSGGTNISHSFFDNTIIRHDASIFGYATFQACSFRNLDWRMVHFSCCLFGKCIFSGRLQKSDANCSSGDGFNIVCDYYRKIRYKGYNVFKDCSFDKLMVTRFSVKDGALTLQNCTGFPTYSSPNKEFCATKDFYSDNTRPKSIQ